MVCRLLRFEFLVKIRRLITFFICEIVARFHRHQQTEQQVETQGFLLGQHSLSSSAKSQKLKVTAWLVV